MRRMRFGFVVALLLGLLPGCIVVVEENDDCEGRPQRVNALDDVALVVGEVLEQDLEAPRFPVFIHTEYHRLDYDVIIDDARIAEVTVVRGQLRVIGRAAGRTEVDVEAFAAGCPETARVRFTVEVRAAGRR